MKNIESYFNRILAKVTWKLRQYRYDLTRIISIPFVSKRLLIARFDAIGDTILFFNCLEALKEDKRWSGFKFVFLGNSSCKELLEHYGTSLIEEYIWVAPAVVENTHKREYIDLLWKLKLMRFAIVLNPVHSRTEEIDRFFRDIRAQKTIGSKGDLIRQREEQKQQTDAYYDLIIKVPDHTNFEFFRNISFVNELVGNNRTIRLSLPYTKEELNPKPRIALFPGAGVTFRRWPPTRFARLVQAIENFLPERFSYCLLGSAQDSEICESILTTLPHLNMENKAGKTTLVELVNLIGNSSLLISNETSAVHIAAATQTPFICISNGNHFGRFNPYPESIISNSITVYPDERFSDQSIKEMLIEENKLMSIIDINLISEENVFNKVKVLLEEIVSKWDN